MIEFKDSTFAVIENRIHAARFERSAVLGEAIGEALAQAWFALRKLFVAGVGHATALKERTNASQPLPEQQRIAAPH